MTAARRRQGRIRRETKAGFGAGVPVRFAFIPTRHQSPTKGFLAESPPVTPPRDRLPCVKGGGRKATPAMSSRNLLHKFTATFITPEGAMAGDFWGRTIISARRKAREYAERRDWTLLTIAERRSLTR